MTTHADDRPEEASAAPLRIAVSANFVAEPLAEPLQYWLSEMGIASSVVFAPYNQVYQQLLDPASLLGQNRGGLNVILLRLEDWCSGTDETSPAARLQRNVRDFLNGVGQLRNRHSGPMIVAVCPNPPSAPGLAGRTEPFREMEDRIAAELARTGATEFVSSLAWTSLYPASGYHDERADVLAHIPYTPLFYSSLALMIVRKFHKLKFPPRKVIVLDCDNTLWNGVVGEDGPEGISIDAPRQALQEFVLEQQRRGMLVALCSKNNEPEVWEVFDKRADMLLQRRHIVSARINWSSKTENLALMAKELGLSLDSFVFVDDDPVACAEVRARLPEVLTLLLPAAAGDIPAFLQHVWVFDHEPPTAEDRRRTQLYQEHFLRERVRHESQSLAEFIANLNLAVEISPMAEPHVQRVSELTFRTNQFNTTAVQRTAGEIGQLLRSGSPEGLVVHAKDRLGDYGLVGVVFFTAEANRLVVDNFLLSCRALGRGVEHQVAAFLGVTAKQREFETVDFVCVPSPKNLPAVQFLESLPGVIRESVRERLVFRLPAELAASTTYSASDCASPDLDVDGGEGETGSTRTEAARMAALNAFLASTAEMRDARSIRVRFVESRSRTSLPVTAAPNTPVEARIGAIVSELLGVDTVDVQQGFFEMGGHSLIAMQVLSRVNAEFNVELTPMLLFTSKFAVADLADAVVKEQLQRLETDEVDAIFRELSELTNPPADTLSAGAPAAKHSLDEKPEN